MMGGVFSDIKYFIAFFMIFIAQFGIIFTILFRGKDVDEYDGVMTASYFIMMFRMSTGDFYLDDYAS